MRPNIRRVIRAQVPRNVTKNDALADRLKEFGAEDKHIKYLLEDPIITKAVVKALKIVCNGS